MSAARNTYEKNIMYGPGGMALYHHCGKGNMGVNNVVHKTDRGQLYKNRSSRKIDSRRQFSRE